MASSPGSRTLGFIASPPAVSRPCGLPFASVVSTFPAPSGRPKPHETSALMSIPGEELHRGLFLPLNGAHVAQERVTCRRPLPPVDGSPVLRVLSAGLTSARSLDRPCLGGLSGPTG